MHVQEGDLVAEEALLAELNTAELTRKFEAQKKAYSEKKKEFRMYQRALQNSAKNGATESSIQEMEVRQSDLAAQLNQLQEEVNNLRAQREAFSLISPNKGTIKTLNKVDYVCACW